MKLYIKLFLIIGLLSFSGILHAQYALPTNFVSTDSNSVHSELTKFSKHVAIHFSDIPGYVFSLTEGYPRVQFYYQHDYALTSGQNQYVDFTESGATSVGVFSAIGDVTPNLQVILRYNPMRLSGEAAVFNGYGMRYRTAALTDTMSSFTIGVMLQKLSGANIHGVKTLDFSMQYGRYAGKYIYLGDITGSFVSGELPIEKLISQQFDGTYEKRVIHFGVGLLREWNHFNVGVKLRTTGKIWNGIIAIGWRLPSRN